jgi:hypothetical protein
VPLPEASLCRKVEEAGGILAGRFALCQRLPLDQVADLAEQLRPAGYRPVRVRPYAAGDNLLAAVVWTRDLVPWDLRVGLTLAELEEADRKMRPRSLWPLDVAGYPGEPDRFVALWSELTGGATETRLTVRPHHSTPASRYGTAEGFGYDRLIAEGFQAAARQFFFRGKDEFVQCMVWRKPREPWWEYREGTVRHYEDHLYAARFQLDVGLTRAEFSDATFPYYSACWGDKRPTCSVEVHGLAPEAHLARCRELAAAGLVPAAVGVMPEGGKVGALAASVWHGDAAAVERQVVRDVLRAGGKAAWAGDRASDRVTGLDLSAAKPTRALLLEVALLRDLRDLNLSGAPVTDAGLRHLGELQRLKKLDLRGCPVGEATLKDLRTRLPNCTIEVSLPEQK